MLCFLFMKLGRNMRKDVDHLGHWRAGNVGKFKFSALYILRKQELRAAADGVGDLSGIWKVPGRRILDII